MEWLPKLYQQHKNWPGLLRWVFVEAADPEYTKANPDMVSLEGLSVDGTTEFLTELAEADDRVIHFKLGVATGPSPERHKLAARQAYVVICRGANPDFLVVLDSDEFYTYEDQRLIIEKMASYPNEVVSWSFRKREIWHPPSLGADVPLLTYEVVEGFWGIPCCHWWRYDPTLTYDVCHNTPTIRGKPGNEKIVFVDDGPQMLHLGYASSLRAREAKHRYYAGRGEKDDPARRWYVESRAAWFDWKLGSHLPGGAKVIPYIGPIPEVLRGDQA